MKNNFYGFYRPSKSGAFEKDRSDRPYSRERINSGLYKINIVDNPI